MRGRLYPQPRERYERFRLNPYSPLYQGLAVFFSAPPVAGTQPELHGPYALPGAVCSPMHAMHSFFPEIGRAAISYPTTFPNSPRWPIAPLPSGQIITLTVVTIIGGDMPWKGFMVVYLGESLCATIVEWSYEKYPICDWRDINNSRGYATNSACRFPLNTWFTYSGIFRPGSVNAYLSNWGIINLNLRSGSWPTAIKAADNLMIAGTGDGSFVADGFVHLRELSLTELHAISDLSNVDYRMSGEAPLILPVRTYWPSVLPVAPSYLKRRSLGARVGTREAVL